MPFFQFRRFLQQNPGIFSGMIGSDVDGWVLVSTSFDGFLHPGSEPMEGVWEVIPPFKVVDCRHISIQGLA